MQIAGFFSLCLVAASAMGTDVQGSATPVQKVIEMLQGMLEKGKKEKHEEQLQFASYKQWCDDTTVEKQTAIKTANQQLEMLLADIQKYQTDAETLTEEIAKLDEDVSVWSGDQKAATKVREMKKLIIRLHTKTTLSPLMLWRWP